MLFIGCAIGGLWYEEILKDRRDAEVTRNAARMEEFREKLWNEINMTCGCHCDCKQCTGVSPDEKSPEPMVEMSADSVPVARCDAPDSESVMEVVCTLKMKAMRGSRTPITCWGDPGVACGLQATTVEVDGDGHAVSTVGKALWWLKLTQGEDGCWGTNGVADTAFAVLTYLRHGETDCSPEFGRTVLSAAEYLVGAVERGQVAEADAPLVVCALASVYETTRNPNAGDAVRILLERTDGKFDESNLFQCLLMTEARKNAQWFQLTNGTAMTQLAERWGRVGANGDEIAFKCLGQMWTGGTNASVMAALDAMRNWKPGERDLRVEYAAGECKWLAGMRAKACPKDIRSWMEWNREMKALYPKAMVGLPGQVDATGQMRSSGFWKKAGYGDLQATCLISLQLMTHPGRYLPAVPPSSDRSTLCEPEVEVEVDI